MKGTLKTVILICITAMVMLLMASCDSVLNLLPHLNETNIPTTTIAKEETTPPQETTTLVVTTTSPEETTTLSPVVTTSPEETTTTPLVVTTPPEETTTTPPVVTTPPEETTTSPEETTTSPEETTTTPPVQTTPEDLPADEDGYAYPEYFANLVHQTIVDYQLFNERHDGVNYRKLVTNQIPEIIFVDRVSTKEESGVLAIYARYETDKGESLYIRMSFEIDGLKYLRLGVNTRYGSYAEYVGAMQTALEERAILKNANISMLYTNQDTVNDGLGENFAKFVGQDFVDASINCTRFYMDQSNQFVNREISGFAYDKDGNSYSYVVRLRTQSSYLSTIPMMLQDINDGKLQKTDLASFESASQQITSVFKEEVDQA